MQLRRQPVDAGRRRLRSARTSSSAVTPFRDTYFDAVPAAPSRSTTPPATPTGTAPTPPAPRPETSLDETPTSSASTVADSTASRPARYVMEYKVCGVAGVLRCRLGGCRAAGDPRRRRRDQLLDLRRHQPVHRPRRAGLPRRLRGRRVRVRFGGQRRPRGGDGQPPVAVGHHRGGVDPDPRVRPRTLVAHRRATATTFPGDGAIDHRRRRTTLTAVVLAQNVPGVHADGARCAAPSAAPIRPRRLRRAASSPASASVQVACLEELQVSGRAAARAWSSTTPVTLPDVETDNHWVPTVHLPDGTDVPRLPGRPHRRHRRRLAAGAAARLSGRRHGRRSRRGARPGCFLKPDVTAPGRADPRRRHHRSLQPPTRSTAATRPASCSRRSRGTSMSSPHVAGAGPAPRGRPSGLEPGADQVGPDDHGDHRRRQGGPTSHPADPFDFGSGRIDIGAASAAPLTFSDTAENFFAMANDPLNAVHLNIPSVNAPVMPGRLVTTPGGDQRDRPAPAVRRSSADAPDRVDDHASRRSQFRLDPGQSQTLTIIIESDAPIGEQQFGSISLVERGGDPAPPAGGVHPHPGRSEPHPELRPGRDPPARRSRRAPSRRPTTRSTSRPSISTRSVSSNLRIAGADGADLVDNRHAQLARRHAGRGRPGRAVGRRRRDAGGRVPRSRRPSAWHRSRSGTRRSSSSTSPPFVLQRPDLDDVRGRRPTDTSSPARPASPRTSSAATCPTGLTRPGRTT